MDRIARGAVTRLRLAACLLPFLAACAAGPPGCAQEQDWQQALENVRHRYPLMERDDALKYVQQAAMGSEHWVQAGDAERWMQSEWASLGDGPAEPLVDTLWPTARFARINLRAYRTAGGSPGPLLAAFVAASRSAPDSAAIRCGLEALLHDAGRRSGAPSRDSLRRAIDDWRARHYPALDHSPRYTAAYRPAYRVVPLASVAGLLAALRPDSARR